MTPTKTKRTVTPEGQAAAGRIAEFRQNVNNGATAKEARATLREIKAGPVAGKKQMSPDQLTANQLIANTNAKFGTASAPAPTTPAPITPATLAPTTPMKLGEPTPATQAQGMMAEFTDATDTYTADLQAQAKAAEAPKTNALSDYISQLQGAKGLSQLTAESYAGKGGVDEITPELNDINDKIRREQLSMRRQTEAVANAGGQSKAQAQAQINNIERESFAKQADLSIIQQAVQGRYDSAKEIADRAVAAQFEQQANDLAILKFNYEENKELFTKAEQRAFEAAQGDRERKLEAEKQNKQDMYNLGVQASADGAPASVVQRMFQAKTREEALAIGGSYIGALDRAAKQASINASNASAAASSRRQTEIVDIGGVKTLIDSQTGAVISQIKGDGSPQDALATAVAQNNINSISNVLNSKALGATVGPSGFAQTSPGLWGATKRFLAGALAGGAAGAAGGAVFAGVGALPGAVIGALAGGVTNATRGSMAELSGERQNFVGSTEQIREQLTLDKLVQAKANGATFGALSDGERSMLAASASKLGTWAQKDSNGNVTGYNVSEAAFKKEMDFINNMAKLDQILKGADPVSVGATVQPDGTIWVMNSDGTLTQIK